MEYNELKKKVKALAEENGLTAEVADFGTNVDGDGSRLCRITVINICDGDDLLFGLNSGKIVDYTEESEQYDDLFKRVQDNLNYRSSHQDAYPSPTA